MKIVYRDNSIEEQCTSRKKAKRLFGGNELLTNSLMARVNALEQAETILDIVVMPPFHFHKLTNKDGRDLEGFFAINVKSRKDQWRIILEPLDENENTYVPCNIDEIAQTVRTVRIVEVSKHYE